MSSPGYLTSFETWNGLSTSNNMLFSHSLFCQEIHEQGSYSPLFTFLPAMGLGSARA